jgi:hypothetical protein
MKRDGENYLGYLESVVISLLVEREKLGKTDFSKLDGVDSQNQLTFYIPYNIKKAIKDCREQANLPNLKRF